MNKAGDFMDVVDDISILKGSKNELVVFENSNDTHSFLELLKLNGQENNRTLVTLNSVENTKEFLKKFSYFEGKIFLCLNGNKAGDAATRKILEEFDGRNSKDIRKMYDISEHGNQNLKEYLDKKLNKLVKNTTLVEPKIDENEYNRTESGRIPNTQHLGSESSERNFGKPLQNSQSDPIGIYRSGQTLGSNNAGNGLADTIWKHLVGDGERGKRSNDRTKPIHVEENGGRKNSVGGIVSGRIVSNRTEKIINSNSTNTEELDSLISKYKGQKLTNEQVAEVVSAACFVSDDNQIILKKNLEITDDLRGICNQFKSGGTAKEGRGILDEYYTDAKIVDAVHNLIKDQFKGKNEISVLEPSVGTGSFLYAAEDLGIKAKINAFEINETTAKIAKI